MISDTVATLLKKRHIPESQWEEFLRPDYNKLGDPLLMKDLEKGVVRLFEAIEAKEKICIYADYDCDGIPGASAMATFLKKVSPEYFEKYVLVYIPDRHEEGYGLHHDALVSIIDSGVTLLITIDLGITAIEEVIYAEGRGCNVIVTDHHLPKVHDDGSDQLPHCFAVINPKRSDCQYPEKMLCGSGVIFTFIRGFLDKYREYFNVHVGWEKWLLDFVGVATLSDMVPLVGENRILAYFGMEVLKQNKRLGFKALFKSARMDVRYMTEEDVAFTIAPRINAASRMDKPICAYHLLVADTDIEADIHASHLSKINDTRKSEVARIMKEVHKELDPAHEQGLTPSVVVIGNPLWRVGVLGLVASKIVEKYGRSAFVWGREGGESIKGSCRSDGTVHVVELMRALPEGILLAHGGHVGAGGFTVSNEGVFSLRESLITSFETSTPISKETITNFDLELPLSKIDKNLYKDIRTLAPFGEANKNPIFRITDARIKAVKNFGKETNHLEVIFEDSAGREVKSIQFFKTIADYAEKITVGNTPTILGTVELDTFARFQPARLRIIDIL
ncbi:MAG: single-stranded-DNA-specific exonuclease RecJ [bacterium]